MEVNKLKFLSEAYVGIYEDKNSYEDYNSEYSNEDDLDQIMEELVYELIDDGLDIDSVEDIFETVLLELNPYAPAGSREAKAYNKSTTNTKRKSERQKQRDVNVAKVKDSVKTAIDKAKKTKKSVDSSIKSSKQKSHVSLAKYASKRELMPGAGLKTQSSKGRGELRSAVAKDVASRTKEKVKSAGKKVTSSAQKAGQAVQSASDRTREKIQNVAASTKSGIKKGLRGLALGVARRMKEDVDQDVYDIILSHLLDEGYATTIESAGAIMVNMSEEWKQSILEGEYS